METVYIGLGSNRNNPTEQIQYAICQLATDPDITLVKQSSLHQSKPWGGMDNQPDFVNAVIEIKTALAPLDLLKRLQNHEVKQGRQRDGERWGPRIIDLDILLYGSEVIETPELTVPHMHMCGRHFVLNPLYEINPDLILPNGHAIVDYQLLPQERKQLSDNIARQDK